jgi:hypothetical protein
MTPDEQVEYDRLHAERVTLENKEPNRFTQADSDRLTEIRKRTAAILDDRVNLSEDQKNRLRSIDDILHNLVGDAEPRPAASEFSARARAEAEAKAGAKESRDIARDEKERDAIIRKIERDENRKADQAAFREQARADAVREGKAQTGWLSRLRTSPWRTAKQRADGFAKRFYANEIMAAIRQARGMNKHETEMARARLQEYRKTINPLIGEHRKWIREMHRDPDTAAKNPSRIQQLINHIEAVDGYRLSDTDPLFKVAEALRNEYSRMRTEIEGHFPDFSSFYDDYYRHLWARPDKLDDRIGFSRQGTAQSLKQRKWMTMMDGIRNGATPKILDPLDNMLHYAQGMRDFLAAKGILDHYRVRDVVYYGTGARAAGDIPLKGRAAEIGKKDGGIMRAYAPGGFASKYNSWVGRGFYDWGRDYGIDVGAAYDKLQIATSLMTGFKLAISGFHAMNIAQEAAAAGLAKALGHLSHGEFLRFAGELALSVPIIPKVIQQRIKGKRIQKLYQETRGIEYRVSGEPMRSPNSLLYGDNILVSNSTREERAIVDLLVRANAQFIGRGQEYMIGGMGQKGPLPHFGFAFKPSTHATWRAEHAQAARDVIGHSDEAVAKRVVASIPRGIRFVADEAASVTNMIMAPLFDHTIPHIKIAASFDELAMWVRQHPDASFEEKMSVARRISDSMDNRFGEMVQDNMFWPRVLKQVFNAAVVSVGWEWGTLRAFGGAVKELLHAGDTHLPDQHFMPHVRWLAGATATYALQNSYYQYFMTQQFPWETGTALQDMFQGGRTGGKTPQGQPERGRMPSVAKDVWNAYELFGGPTATFAKTGNPLPLGQAGVTWAMEKGNPFSQMVHEGVTGRDNFGNEIPTPGPNDKTPLWKRAEDYFLRQIDPIVFESIKNRKAGTKIPVWQNFLGVAPLGRQYTDPEGVAKAKEFHEAMVRKEAAAREMKQQQQLETPDQEKINELQLIINDAKAELASSRRSGGGGGRSRGSGEGGSRGRTDRGIGGGGSAWDAPSANYGGGIIAAGSGGGSSGGGGIIAGGGETAPASGGTSSRSRSRGSGRGGGGRRSNLSNRGRRRVSAASA